MIKILIVDDHDLVRTGVRRLLEDIAAFEVVGECASGEEAVEFCRVSRPDIVLMDINMPGIGGIAAARKILRCQEGTKVIILTAQSEQPLAKHVMENGIPGYLTKGSDAQEMVRAINCVRSGQRYVSDDVAHKMAMSMIDGGGGSLLRCERQLIAKRRRDDDV